MLKLRRLHTYLAVFFAPILIFFIATGWYQTVVIDRKKGLGEAETWIDRMTSVHVDQIYPTPTAEQYSPKLFQGFVVVMSIALLVTIALGVVLAFRTIRPWWIVATCLGAGVLVPMVILYLGQK